MHRSNECITNHLSQSLMQKQESNEKLKWKINIEEGALPSKIDLLERTQSLGLCNAISMCS